MTEGNGLVEAARRFCPRDRQQLKEKVLHGVQVDVCQHCDGVWLDAGEMEALAPSFVESEVQKRYQLPRSYVATNARPGAAKPASRVKQMALCMSVVPLK